MVKKEFYKTRDDGVRLVRSYSDTGMMIQGTDGYKYVAAIDPEEMHRTYTETSDPIEETDVEALMRMVEGPLQSGQKGTNI